MTNDEPPRDLGDGDQAEDRDETKIYVEQLLSACETTAPRVYVLELMCVQPDRSTREPPRCITAEYNFKMWPIMMLASKVSLHVWPGREVAEKGIATRSAAMLANPGKLEALGLCGESIWLREVESDELFEAQDRALLLQPRQVREIYSDFVHVALQTRLHSNWDDARLAVLHAAGELLLEVLQEDLGLIPNRFSEVVGAIDEILLQSDWFSLTEDGVRNLSTEVIRRVGIAKQEA